MKKNLDITKPSYSEQILPAPWPFIKLRFHCSMVLKLSGFFKHSSIKQTAAWTNSLVLDNRLNSTIKSRWRLHHIRSLSNYDDDHNDDFKKTISFMIKKEALHVHRAF